jgi:hypothetical protein
VRILVALSIPECDEQLLNSCLSRSEIRLEGWAFDRSQGGSGEPVKDLVSTVTIPAQQEPIVLARQSEDGSETSRLVLVWEAQLALSRPRVRMLDPSISIFSVFLVASASKEEDSSDDILQPFAPAEFNVLAPLSHMSTYAESEPYLAMSRLERVLPEPVKTQKQFRLEHMTPRYRIVPPAVAKLNYSRFNMASSIPKIIASLNLEIIPFVDLQATIQTLEVKIASGSIEDLTSNILPLKCRSKDIITFLYRLSQTHTQPDTTGSPSPASQLLNFDVLSIRLYLQITLSEVCHPVVRMDFNTNIDFFQALNPSYGGPSQPIQRHNRPASLPLGQSNSSAQASVSTSLQPTPPMINPNNFSGITVSFTAPDGPVKVGETFLWRVLVNNRSAKAAKLAIYPLPHMPRAQATSSSGRRHASRTSMTSYRSFDGRKPREIDAKEAAEAVVDENIIYAIQHANSAPKQTDVVSLTAELRVGALGPGQCNESEIELVAMKAGTLRVDAMRVVDLIREAEEGIGSAGVMIDIRDLPDVVAVM